MKFLTLLLTSLIFISTVVSAAETTVEDLSKNLSYDYLTNYDGSFKTNRLYLRTEINQLWSRSNRPKTLSEIICTESLNALRANGTWIGNLSNGGKCLGYAEAPEWTTGNYMNFITIRSKQNNANKKNTGK